jgi:hypothetical protein
VRRSVPRGSVPVESGAEATAIQTLARRAGVSKKFLADDPDRQSVEVRFNFYLPRFLEGNRCDGCQQVNPVGCAAQLYSPSYHSHHDAAANNPDLFWLRSRTTYRMPGSGASGGGPDGQIQGSHQQFPPND